MNEKKETKISQDNEVAAILRTIREFLASSSPIYASAVFDQNTPLLKGAALDSLGILNLTMFLSKTMNIEIVAEDFIPENFNTVGNLATFVIRKRREAP